MWAFLAMLTTALQTMATATKLTRREWKTIGLGTLQDVAVEAASAGIASLSERLVHDAKSSSAYCQAPGR